ncbi:hypothetical protein A8L50_22870 [Pantoea ananatis]|nr:hypothetical protein [Pantoea ananatis]NQE82156.1 hypothetical protein [Pantoea ananatis]
MSQSDCSGKTLKLWPVFVDHFMEKSGIDFNSIQDDIDQVKIAFQIRHIGIHNMSIVDENFRANTHGLGTPGQPYVVDQDLINRISSATGKMLKHLDVNLPPLPA